MMVIEIDQERLRDQINFGVTLVYFYTTECDSCPEQIRIIEELAQELGRTVTFAKVNIQEEKNIAEEYGVTNTPTIILFKDGYQVEALFGLQHNEALQQTVLRYLSIGETC